MSIPGVKIAISKATMKKAIIGHRGCVSKAAKGLRIAPSTLQRKIDNDPELKTLVHELRHEYDEMIMDEVEDTIKFALINRKKDLTNAVKIVMWLSDRKGKGRGLAKSEEVYDAKVIGNLHTIKKVVIQDGNTNIIEEPSEESEGVEC